MPRRTETAASREALANEFDFIVGFIQCQRVFLQSQCSIASSSSSFDTAGGCARQTASLQSGLARSQTAPKAKDHITHRSEKPPDEPDHALAGVPSPPPWVPPTPVTHGDPAGQLPSKRGFPVAEEFVQTEATPESPDAKSSEMPRTPVRLNSASILPM